MGFDLTKDADTTPATGSAPPTPSTGPSTAPMTSTPPTTETPAATPKKDNTSKPSQQAITQPQRAKNPVIEVLEWIWDHATRAAIFIFFIFLFFGSAITNAIDKAQSNDANACRVAALADVELNSAIRDGNELRYTPQAAEALNTAITTVKEAAAQDHVSTKVFNRLTDVVAAYGTTRTHVESNMDEPSAPAAEGKSLLSAEAKAVTAANSTCSQVDD